MPSKSFVFYNQETLNDVSMNYPGHYSVCENIRTLDSLLQPVLMNLDPLNMDNRYTNFYDLYRSNFKTILDPLININTEKTIEAFSADLRTAIETASNDETSHHLMRLNVFMERLNISIYIQLYNFILSGSHESFGALYGFYTHLYNLVNDFKTRESSLTMKLWPSYVLIFNGLKEINNQLNLETESEDEDICCQLGIGNIDDMNNELISINEFIQKCQGRKEILLHLDDDESISDTSISS